MTEPDHRTEMFSARPGVGIARAVITPGGWAGSWKVQIAMDDIVSGDLANVYPTARRCLDTAKQIARVAAKS